MDNKKVVLVLSAPIGSGHVQAANAVAQAFSKEDGVEVKVAGIFEFFPGWASKLLLNSYLLLLRIYPNGYAFLYKWGDNQGSLGLRGFVNWLFALGANKFIEKCRPDVVIATHVTPAGIIALYKKKYGKQLPLIGIVTDYAMHKWWIYKEINAYVVPDREILAGYENDIENGQEIWPLGIPVRSQFCHADDREKLRKQLGLPQDGTICLLTGGGEGLLPMAEILDAWHKQERKKKVFFVAICGRNEKLEKDLFKMQAPGLMALGYIDNIADYMKAADVVVSKAGGVTATEALACGLPLIIYRPLPGQEIINARYLFAKKLAFCADRVHDVCLRLEDIAAGAVPKAKVQENALKAADKIVKQVKDYLNW